MLLRIFLILALLVGGLLWLRRLLRSKRPPEVKPAAEAIEQAMVRCARCGLHVPRGESIDDAQGRSYCCDEHRRADH